MSGDIDYSAPLDLTCENEILFETLSENSVPSTVESGSNLKLHVKPPMSNKCWVKDSKKKIAFESVYNVDKGLLSYIISKMRANAKFVEFPCLKISTTEKFQIKVLLKQCQPKFNYSIESKQCRSLKHENIITLLEIYESSDFVFFVTIYIHSNNLIFQHIEASQIEYNENRVIIYVRQVLEALMFLHNHELQHGNLWNENIYVFTENKNENLKIGDYYLNNLHLDGYMFKNTISKYTYSAPEKLMHGVVKQRGDIWSVGVLTYILLMGYNPFIEDDNINKSFSNVVSNTFTTPKNLDEYALAFIKGCICSDPSKRMSVYEAMKTPFVVKTERKLKSLAHVLEPIRRVIISQNEELELGTDIAASLLTPPKLLNPPEVSIQPKHRRTSLVKPIGETRPTDLSTEDADLESADWTYKLEYDKILQTGNNFKMADILFGTRRSDQHYSTRKHVLKSEEAEFEYLDALSKNYPVYEDAAREAIIKEFNKRQKEKAGSAELVTSIETFLSDKNNIDMWQIENMTLNIKE